jgi:hypothetical protein
MNLAALTNSSHRSKKKGAAHVAPLPAIAAEVAFPRGTEVLNNYQP